MESILTTVKKAGGMTEEFTAYDDDVIMHTNTVFMNLRQMGVGPETGFSIKDKTATWSDFTDNIEVLEAVKTFVSLKVKLIFDTPQSSTVMQAIKDTIAECEWRILHAVECELKA